MLNDAERIERLQLGESGRSLNVVFWWKAEGPLSTCRTRKADVRSHGGEWGSNDRQWVETRLTTFVSVEIAPSVSSSSLQWQLSTTRAAGLMIDPRRLDRFLE